MKKICKISAIALIVMLAAFFTNVDAKIIDPATILDITATEDGGNKIPVDVYIIGRYAFYNVYTTSDLLMAMNDYMLNTPAEEQQPLQLIVLTADSYETGAEPTVKIENALTGEAIDEEDVTIDLIKIYNLDDAETVAENGEDEGAEATTESGKPVVVFAPTYHVTFYTLSADEETGNVTPVVLKKVSVEEGACLTTEDLPDLEEMANYPGEEGYTAHWYNVDDFSILTLLFTNPEEAEVIIGEECTEENQINENMSILVSFEADEVEVTYDGNGGYVEERVEIDEETYNAWYENPEESEYNWCYSYGEFGDEYACTRYIASATVTEVFGEQYSLGSYDTYRYGYEFDGWCLDADCETPAEETITTTEAHTLYASWTLVDEEIIYELNEGEYEGESNPETYNLESDFELIAPVREHYDFVGWFVTGECDEETGECEKIYITEVNPSELDVNYAFITAEWTPTEYEITYVDELNGTLPGEMTNPETYSIENEVHFLEPAEEGYRFIGWSLEDGTIVESLGGFDSILYEDVTLTANWVKLISANQIVFDVIDNITTDKYEMTFNGETINVAILDNASGLTTNSGLVAALRNVLKTGDVASITLSPNYVLDDAGWVEGYEGTLSKVQNTLLTMLKDVTGKDDVAEIRLADLLGKSFDVTITPSDTSELDDFSESKTYTLNITGEFVVTYNDEAGNEIATERIQPGNKANDRQAPEKLGYTFVAWYLDEDPYDFDTILTQDITLVATYTLDTTEYTLSFQADGAVAPNSIKITNGHTYGDYSLSTIVATKEGYDFGGWFFSKADATNNTNPVTDEAEILVSGDTTLYARFTPTVYNVTYEGLAGATNENALTYTIESPITLVNPVRTDGYTFVNWTEDETPITEISGTGDRTITANWSATEYTITYNNVDGATNTNPASYTVLDEDIVLADATKDNFKFAGWYDNADFEGEKITQISVNAKENVVLYARWLDEYTITYSQLADSELEGTDTYVTTYTVEDAFTLVTPVRDGYDFGGWYTDAGYTSDAVTAISIGTTGDKEFFAKWDATAETVAAQIADVTAKANTISGTWYNHMGSNTDYTELTDAQTAVYYTAVDYVDDEVAYITLNERVFNSNIKWLSVGNNSYIGVPVWTQDEETGMLSVASVWLYAMAIPGTTVEVIAYDDEDNVIGKFVYTSQSTTSATELTMSSVKILGGVYKQDLDLTDGDTVTTNATLTYDSTTKEYTYTAVHGNIYVGIVLNDGENDLNTANGIPVYRIASNGSIGITTSETLSGQIINYGAAPSWKNGYFTEEEAGYLGKMDYILALPGVGYAHFKMNVYRVHADYLTVDPQ